MTFESVLAGVERGLGSPWVRGALVAVVGLIVVRIAAAVVHRRLAAAANPHWALVARKAVNYGGAAVVSLLAARALGIDVTALAATAGVAGVAIGFASQTSLSNLIAGLFLLFDRPFKVGDTVEIEGRMGQVLEVTLMSTLVRTFGNVLVRWPNEVVLKATILNYTRFEARRIDLPVGVAYGSDLTRAREVLLAAVRELGPVLIEPEPEVVSKGFLESAVELEVRAWVAAPDFLVGRNALVEAIHDSLGEAGITIPFPQRTVWMATHPKADTPSEDGEEPGSG